MSNGGERPRDPDPAALAELQRAFGGRDDGERPHDDAGDDRDDDRVTERIDTVADEVADAVPDPEASEVTGAVEQTGDDADVVPDPEAAEVIGAVEQTGDDADVVTSRVDQVGDRDDGGGSERALLDADLPDVERPADGGDDLLIVEQEVAVEPDPSRPRTIRIDGYGGNVDVDAEPHRDGPPGDATPESLATGGGDDDAGDSGASSSEPPAVISISDDEIPDAVYVEGSLDRDGSASLVIIEDDETGDALQPESERALRRGIEPRIHERRIAVRRAQGRKRLTVVVVVVGVVLVVVLGLAALGTFFVVRADDVRVYNAVYTDQEQLDEIIDDAVGTPVLLIDTTEYEERIEEIPWVDRAAVRTDFPHGLVIEMRERAAIATYQGPDDRFRVIDREGRVLDVLDLYPYAYVLVGGPDALDLDAGEFAPRGYAAAAELAKNLTATVRGRVNLIEVNAEGSRLQMYLDDGSTVFFGEARDLLAKLVRLEAVLTNGQDREPGLIDVSTADVTR